MDSLASDKLGKSRPRSDSRTDDTRLLPNLSDPEKEGIFRIENIKILKLRDIQAFLSNLIIYRRRIIIYTRIYMCFEKEFLRSLITPSILVLRERRSLFGAPLTSKIRRCPSSKTFLSLSELVTSVEGPRVELACEKSRGLPREYYT